MSRTECLLLQVDLLEIALREQHDLVEKIFLVEATANHRGVHLMMMISLSLPVRGRDPAGTDTGCEAVLVGGTQCPQPAATQKFSHKK